MAAQQRPYDDRLDTIATNEEKGQATIFEDDHPEKAVPRTGNYDKFGAHEKTDPKEIALVKKLDRWIMPMLWSMYWLNYLGMFPVFSCSLHLLT